MYEEENRQNKISEYMCNKVHTKNATAAMNVPYFYLYVTLVFCLLLLKMYKKEIGNMNKKKRNR